MEFNSDNIKNMLKQHEKSFEIFRMKYTNTEKQCINNFHLDDKQQYNEYSHFGKIKNMKNLKKFLSTIGQNDMNMTTKMKKIIKKITKIVIKGYNTKYFWISIRISQPNDLFKTPRWHQDGLFFNNNDHQSKFITVLRGDGTLLIESNETCLSQYTEIFDENMKYNRDNNIRNFKEQIKIQDEIFRPKMAKKLSESKDCKIIQLNNDNGAIFYVGDFKTAAIHSEPMINYPRIFISILPGSEKDIKVLAIRFGKKQYGGFNHVNVQNLHDQYKQYKLDYVNLKNIYT